MAEWTLQDRRHPDKVLHPSTQGAVLALQQWLGQAPRRALDMGCGSGLLTLMMAERWPDVHIAAVDISPHAVEDAAANVARYGLEKRVTVLRSNGFSHSAIREKGPYDLMTCNLLAEILVPMAPEIHACLAEEGCAVLSGILAWMQPQVEAACLTSNLRVTASFTQGEWVTLMVTREI